VAVRIRDQDKEYGALRDDRSGVVEAFNDLVAELEEQRDQLRVEAGERARQAAETERLKYAQQQLL
jgi:hypothetical protein